MKYVFALVLAAMMIFAGCAASQIRPPQNHTGNNTTVVQPPANNSTGTGIPNPASKFCADSNYKLELRGSTGVCIFQDGRECEEWAFFRGECTDIDSFEMVRLPGFTANPKTTSFKFYSDGRLSIVEAESRTGNTSTLVAWLKPADFASFVKTLNTNGFDSLNDSYSTCAGEAGCPTDGPSVRFALLRQGNAKEVYVYGPADYPASIDNISGALVNITESATFVDVTSNNCTLMREGNVYGCFGCPGGITYPKCIKPALAAYAVTPGPDTGSCTIGADNACAYVPPAQISKELCSTSGGRWNECGSLCRDPRIDVMCPALCVPYCECGTNAGYSCPTGFFCTEFVPTSVANETVGLCKRIA